jgi:NADH dehydrogenase (ubiquinone) Fe-S protein 6
MGSHDQTLVESEAEAKEMRAMQAPNRKGIWSRSQKPREQAMAGPRFEQMILKDQVRFFSVLQTD